MVLTLKQARQIKEKTQKEMANHLGVSEDTYRKIEQDPDRATIRQAKEISAFVGLSYDEIFFCKNSSLTRDIGA